MASNTRQNTLLANTVWQKLYRTFQQADFKSYDFDTIRRTLIDYLQLNYPESFNDFIESSEYVALIDMISYVAQSISYRVDLNARENFIDLAERKDSVLRLARLISYQPKRNTAGNGFVKINSVATTESVTDSNGQNIANTQILWNDLTNDNWQDQFNTVINSSLPKNQFVNKPEQSDTIGGINSQIYRINGANLDLPTVPFSQTINGVGMEFSIVPCSFAGEKFVYEEAPIPGNSMSFLYRNDNRGFGSNNTGYFLHFRQGVLNSKDFSITNTAPNTVVSIQENNINNDDVFLFKLDQNGVLEQRWRKVPAIVGNNVIYNNLAENITNQFAVVTKNNDQIDLVFSDGVYGTLPQGNFRCYYRQSNGLTYNINTSDMQNISIALDYVSKNGQTNTLTIQVSLQSSVTNASESESIADIKTLAPQSYYANNRMISAEDYQILPLTENQSIAKAKSQVRTASGVSRFLDITDPTGVYSQTNIVADDGVLYQDEGTNTFDFQFSTRDDVEKVINTTLSDVFTSSDFKQYYYKNYPRITPPSDTLWNKSTQTVNQATGYFGSAGPLSVGGSTTNNLRYLTAGALVKFTPTAGNHFMPNGTQMSGTGGHPGSSDVIWSKIVSVNGDGANGGLGNLSDGTGPVVLNDLAPTDAVLSEIIPQFIDSIPDTLKASIIDLVVSYDDFGLSYNTTTRTFDIVLASNLGSGAFALTNQGDTTGANLDNSWLIKFVTNGISYTVTHRKTQYVFQSATRNKFYFDPTAKVIDPQTGLSVKDKIRIVASNTGSDFTSSLKYDYDWQIVGNVVGSDGYNDTRKIGIGFFDSDDDGVIDNPDLFSIIVGPDTDVNNKYVFYETETVQDYDQDRIVDQTQFVVVKNALEISNFSTYPDGQLFYYYGDDAFHSYSATTGTTTPVTTYTARLGRQNLIYNYNHGAVRNRRIDPSVSNIIDLYVVTRSFDQELRTWLRNSQVSARPEAPTIFDLETAYLASLDGIKSISDEIIFNPGEYKLLFGPGADASLQAQFKVIKNPQSTVSDNQIKSSVISAIDTFFQIDFWDFGDTFYYTELAAYIHNALAGDVLSVVIVPAQSTDGFGSLFQIYAEDNEIFVSSATVDNVEIITSISAEKLKATGSVITSSAQTTTTGTVSATSTTTSGTVSTTGSTTSTSSSSSSSSSSGSSSGGYY